MGGKEAGKKTFIEYAIDYSRANAPLARDLSSDDVGNSAAFLLSPLANAVSGVTLYVDNGMHAMGLAVDSEAMAGANAMTGNLSCSIRISSVHSVKFQLLQL